MRLKPVREMVEKHQPPLTDIERDFLRPESERLLAELENIDTPHARRSAIGERLCMIGDPRPGVGLRPDGLPDIAWSYVSGGKIMLEDMAKSAFTVQPFYIAKYPVTFAQFQVFLDDPDGFERDEWWQGLHQEGFKQVMEKQQHFKFANHPRENVSWYQSVAFCRWLTARLPAEAWPDLTTLNVPAEPRGRIARFFNSPQGIDQWAIRLPTEWEWQQAATGGDPRYEYPWGSTWDNRRANMEESGLSRTTAVGMYPHGTSPVGALDMSGNVWEWCQNESDKPALAGIAGHARREVRGGAWFTDSRCGHILYRNSSSPAGVSWYWGFRVVCAPPI
jgi:formylglycine-generating enzyme required for sulfatase activity